MTETAVEWLCNEWLYIDQEFDMKLIDKKTYWERLKSVQEQAKAMFEKQIIEAHFEGQSNQDEGFPIQISEQYYNETFKSE